MKIKLPYHVPQSVWSELKPEALICDSYNSGIDDFYYEDIDLTVTP
jgi:hypothetical protein